jgi:hypothetical protein
MVKANWKNAASRLRVFSDIRGSKGDMAETGCVLPYGTSKLDDRPDCVYLVDADGNSATTFFDEFKGRVSGPSGSVSIVHHSECVPSGTRFSYEFKFPKGKLDLGDIKDILSMSMIVGIGSVRSLGHGQFRILNASVQEPEDSREKKGKPSKDRTEVIVTT